MLSLKLNSTDWSIRAGKMSPGLGFETADDLPGLPAQYLADGSHVVEEFSAESSASKRGLREDPGALDFSYDLAAGESALLALRHPSGALTFHLR